jgi:hypothetical protein
MVTVSMSVAGRSWPPRGQVVLHRGARAGVRGGLLRITGGMPMSSAAVRSACRGVCRVSRGGPGFARDARPGAEITDS